MKKSPFGPNNLSRAERTKAYMEKTSIKCARAGRKYVIEEMKRRNSQGLHKQQRLHCRGWILTEQWWVGRISIAGDCSNQIEKTLLLLISLSPAFLHEFCHPGEINDKGTY